MSDVKVTLFKPTGKYYTTERWRLPESVPMDTDPSQTRSAVGPFDMIHSPDFRRIDGGAVLIERQEPWWFAHLFNAEPDALEKWLDGFEPSIYEVPGSELPGMWDSSDFDSPTVVRGPDWKPEEEPI